VEEAMLLVLRDATDLFQADAAAVLGEDLSHIFIAEGAPERAAERALAHVAAFAAGRDGPFHAASLAPEEGQAIAVPLRVQDDLRYVLALWKRGGEFQPDQLDSLGLMGRMVELALEREESLSEAKEQLEATLRVLQYLVASTRPDYSRHAAEVARLASAVAQKLGMSPKARKELRLAGLVHDVGMITLRGEVGDAGTPLTSAEWLIVRQHSSLGSEIAHVANLGPRVQEAIAAHHERMDGSGYPLGSKGKEIPLEARILAACEVYDSMTHRTYHGEMGDPADALIELTRGAGTLYDRPVVTALQAVLDETGELGRGLTQGSDTAALTADPAIPAPSAAAEVPAA
jgi:putative nucleotidyltransferase with HDIG domain